MANDTKNSNVELELLDNNADIELNKPSKSRFLFFLGFFGLFLFATGCFYGLYSKKYDSNSDVEVPESTTYNPKYK